MSLSEKRNNKRSPIGLLETEEAATVNPPEAKEKSAATECQYCFGTGMEVVPDVGARRCSCQTPNRRDRLLKAARIPVRYLKCTLANYDAGNSDSMWKAKMESQILFEDFLARDGQGLLFVGPVGVGKTHLATAILIELITRYKVSGLFYPFGTLLKEIQDSYNAISGTSELSVLKPVFEAEVLVLDELGSQKTTDWVRETLMFIINTRYNEKRLTIFTTNYDDDPKTEGRFTDLTKKQRSFQNDSQAESEIVLKKRKLYDGTLEERIGAPLRSRLYEMCKTVKIEGDDYRKRSTVKTASTSAER